MNILALFLFWVLARTHYSINKVLSDTKYPDPERFIGVQANIRLLHTQNAKRVRRPLSPGGLVVFSPASQASTAVRLCLSTAGRRLVVVSNRLYLSATGVMFGNPRGLCPAPNFVLRSVTLRGRLAVTIPRCRWPSAIIPGFHYGQRKESGRSPAN